MAERPSPGLVPLPAPPAESEWPDAQWPTGPVPAGIDLSGLLDSVFDDDGPLARTFAVVIVHRGRLVLERYQGQLEHFDRAPEAIGPHTALLSWSMAKSMLHAVVGLLVSDGRLALDAPPVVPAWGDPDDPRRAITLEQLLEMRDGLDFVEDYVDERISDVIEMLFGSGQHDMATFAADRPLAADPGQRFNYSSGTSNLISGVVARELGPGAPYLRFLDDRLFGPIGIASARPGFDEVGTWVASSYVHATARDFARFGLLYLRDGVWDQQRLLPAGWADHGRTVRSVDPTDGALYGAHWWVVGDDWGTFYASGYEGQSITICPALDLVCVRLGKTPEARSSDLAAWRAEVVEAFAAARINP